MNRTAKTLLIAAVVFAAAGAAAYVYLVSPTKAPSQIVVETNMNTAPETTPTTPSTDTTTTTPSNAERVYRIDSNASRAQFSIQEDLRGQPFTAVGTTNQVTGEIVLDRTNVGDAQIGKIRINARALATDSTQRDNAIKRMILKSEQDENEYIEFTATKLSGVPQNPKNGEQFDFDVTGNLMISGITKEVTFKGTGQFVSDDELTGTAQATVKRADYSLVIPNIPFVANVSDNVALEINFNAKAVK